MTRPPSTPALSSAVLGSPISHSLSPVLMARGGNIDCERVELGSGQLRDFLNTDSNRIGYSVTMPLKREAWELASSRDAAAELVGVANTLIPLDSSDPAHSGRAFHAYNTDVHGIVAAIAEVLGAPFLDPAHSRAVILGSGATACSALAALAQMGFDEVTVSARREPENTQCPALAQRAGLRVHWAPFGEAASLLRSAQLVISTLPAHGADSLAQELTGADLRGCALLDVSYHPYPSALTQVFREAGGVEVPGWLMLVHQGARQIELMTGRSPQIDQMRTAVHASVIAPRR